MEIDLKADVAYVIVKTRNGYVTIDPKRNDTNVWMDKKGLLSYFDVMEGEGRIIEKFKGSESDEKLPKDI
jgi:hypothetical protein